MVSIEAKALRILAWLCQQTKNDMGFLALRSVDGEDIFVAELLMIEGAFDQISLSVIGSNDHHVFSVHLVEFSVRGPSVLAPSTFPPSTYIQGTTPEYPLPYPKLP
jgi:hypothetical protein